MPCEDLINGKVADINIREADTIDQMALVARGIVGTQLPYAELVGV